MAGFKSLVSRRGSDIEAPASRGDFWDPFMNFRREVDRMFDEFLDGVGTRGLAPAVDVEEDDKEVIVTAELPGMSEKDIQVDLAGDALTIKGEKKAEREHRNSNGWRLERRFGSFERSIRLPFEVTDENVDARFSNGVLTIHVPKPAALQRSARRIEVRAE